MRRIFLLLILALCVAFGQASNVISPETAQLVAKNFMSERTGNNTLDLSDFTLEKTVTDEAGNALYYVFNMPQNGFILISASEQVSPVLAFSIESPFKGNETSAYLEGKYKSQIEAANANPELVDQKAASLWNTYKNPGERDRKDAVTGPYVEPLITTYWNQDKYFNQYCPYNNKAGSSFDFRVPNGCVALTLSNLLNYYRYPTAGVGGVSYVSTDYDDNGNVVDEYGRITERFTGPYDYSSITDEVNAYQGHLGKITYHTGVSARMGYGFEGSGSNGEAAKNALKEHWKFGAGTALRQKSAYSGYDDWVVTVIIPELKKNCPVYYAGYSPQYQSGHAWILDGYVTIDDVEYFHVNWGWGGADNGFYKISLLHTSSFGSFSEGESAIVMAAPSDEALAKPVNSADTLYASQGSVCDGAGNQKYQPNSTRSWLISAPNATNYTFDFRKIKTQKNLDEIIIYNGPTEESGVAGRYSGNYLNKACFENRGTSEAKIVDFEGDRLPDNITVNKSQVLIVFKSNADTITDYGFNINYRASITPNSNYCSGTSAPSYLAHDIISNKKDWDIEGNYNAHINCDWRIQCTFISGYAFNFPKFDLKHGDFVDVFENTNVTRPVLLYRFDVDNMPNGVYSAPAGRLLVKFSSDNVSEGEGFQLEYYAIVSASDNPAFEEVKVFPNPATNFINVEYSTVNAEDLTFQLTDIAGRVIRTENVSHAGGTSTHNMNINDLSNGIYMLRIQSSQGSVTKKVIVN